MTPFLLPEASGTKPRHFTVLVAIICLLALALVAERAGAWVTYLQTMPAGRDAPAVLSLSIGGTLLRVPRDYVSDSQYSFLGKPVQGDLKKLSVAMSWPGLAPAPESINAFSKGSLPDSIILADLEHRTGQETLRGQLETFYKRLARGEFPGPNGLKFLSLSAQASNKSDLIVYDPEKANGFIARCLHKRMAAEAICHRAVVLPTGLELRYRFNGTLLNEWRTLDSAVVSRIEGFTTDQEPAQTSGPSSAREPAK